MQIDEGFGDLGFALVIAAQTPGAAQPAEGAFDHPAPWQHGKAAGGVAAADDLQRAPAHPAHPMHQLAGVASVGPQVAQPAIYGKRFGQQLAGAVAILDIGGQHADHQKQTQCVHQNVSLAPVDLLACVVAALPAGLAALDALTVHNTGRGLAFAPFQKSDVVA